MADLKLFVDGNNEITDKVIICQSNADKLSVKNGDHVEVINADNNLKKVATVEISNNMLDFAGQFAKNILEELQFSGVELTVRPASAATSLTPKLQVPKVTTQQPTPAPTEPSLLSPMPTPPPSPEITPPQPKIPLRTQPAPIPQPSGIPQPTPTAVPQQSPQPAPQPSLSSLPSPPPQPTTTGFPPSPSTQSFAEPATPVEVYPDKVDINMLASQKRGVILKPIIDNNIEGFLSQR